MFVRVKKVGSYQYLQIAQNRREGKRVKQTTIATLRDPLMFFIKLIFQYVDIYTFDNFVF